MLSREMPGVPGRLTFWEVIQMGANPTQALSILLYLIAYVLLAAAFAGVGILALIAALAAGGAGTYFFAKCKPWENQG